MALSEGFIPKPDGVYPGVGVMYLGAPMVARPRRTTMTTVSKARMAALTGMVVVLSFRLYAWCRLDVAKSK